MSVAGSAFDSPGSVRVLAVGVVRDARDGGYRDVVHPASDESAGPLLVGAYCVSRFGLAVGACRVVVGDEMPEYD